MLLETNILALSVSLGYKKHVPFRPQVNEI
jgi:hypothetical protein